MENVARVLLHTTATRTLRSSYHRFTSPAHVAELLRMLTDTMWPGGVVSVPSPHKPCSQFDLPVP
jgi:hypothetical protein